jgi:anti-sigma factor NepR-like protein
VCRRGSLPDEKTVPRRNKTSAPAFGASVFAMSGTCKSTGAAPDAAAPDQKAVEAIGRALEAHYTDLVRAPLPEKFVELLARLEAGDRGSGFRGRDDADG